MVHIDDMSTESVEAWLKRRKEEEKQKEEISMLFQKVVRLFGGRNNE